MALTRASLRSLSMRFPCAFHMAVHAPHLPPDTSASDPLRRLPTIILACVFGLFAGVVGSFVTIAWLKPATSSIFLNSSLQAPPKTILDVNRVSLFRQVTVTILRPSFVSTSAPYAARIVKEEDKIGAGVLLTADGWILTDGSFAKQTFDVLLPDGSILRAKETVQDPLTGIVFANVGGGPYTVAPLGKLSETEIGSVLSIPVSGGIISQTLLKNSNAIFCATPTCALNRSAEELYTAGAIQNVAAYQGAPVFNDRGEIVGLYRSGETEGVLNSLANIVPVQTLPKIIDGLLEKKVATRAALGVKFLDLARTAVRGITGAGRSGAVVTAARTVKKGVPTLKVGDILLAVEDEALGMGKTLPEILAAYKPGASVNLRILREGKETDILVQLQ
ncbi:MAG: peptidase S1 [Candidatus Magasanikbacteria bacterium]|nr:peptidase S1 [Candidatus Magasanikbacteria bacterium]